MRKGFFTVLLALCGLFAFAQGYQIPLQADHSVDVLRNDYQKLNMNYSFAGINSLNVASDKGEFTEIFIPGTYSIGEIGTPKLPAAKDLIEIPFGAEVSVKVISYDVEEYTLAQYGIENKIMPNQPSLAKDVDPSKVVFEYNQKAYNTNSFSNYDLASVEVLGTLRGMRLARLVIAPVKYNPVKGIIRVFNNIQVEVEFKNADIATTKTVKAATYSPYFDVVYSTVINNNKDYEDHPDLTTYPIKYLIVANSMFEGQLDDFIAWKTKKGFEVVVGYTAEIGTSYSAIQTWIHAQYNAGTPESPAPSFVLFVGDTQQIPATQGSSSGKQTDLYYCSVDGDYFPEMYYGRLSATNAAQLQAQLDKILMYEKYEMPDPTYLDNVTLIAGEDGSWNPKVGQPTVHYGTQNYFNAAHGFATVHAYLNSYSGCYETINQGLGFINYTAHGSETSWAGPTLSQSAVNALTNTGKYPLAIGNCCLAADFGYNECFGETWMRAANKGAVGYIGSSPSSYWFEDFYWSVGAFPLQGTNDGYVPTPEESTMGAYDAPFTSNYVCMDATVFVGNLAVTEVDIQGYPQHSSPLYYWQAYNLLGDPSVLTYFTQGTENEVSYMEVLPIGVDAFEVSAAPGSYVAISMDGVLYGTALVDASGVVSVNLEPILQAGLADIVVTNSQYIPYIQQVQVAPLSGPFITINGFSVLSGGDDMIEYGETANMSVTLKNVGVETASGITMTITIDDPYITLVDGGEAIGSISADQVLTFENAFSFTIANNVPNDYSFRFNATMVGTQDTWEGKINLRAYAPALEVSFAALSDLGGNNNGNLDAGEAIIFVFNITNEGMATSPVAISSLSTTSQYVTIVTNTLENPAIEADGTIAANHSLTVSQDAPIGTVAEFAITVAAGQYTCELNFAKKIGLIIEDWESGSFDGFDWEFSGTGEWAISNEAQEGEHSAVSATITDSQQTHLSLTQEVGAAGEISFFYKVSSENNYDYLKFFIDGTEQDSWAGDVDWTQAEYEVTAGTHTFKWTYLKDGSVSSGEDCAWIDYIILPGGEGSGANVYPEFTSSPIVEGSMGMVYTYNVSATHPNGNALTLACVDAPEWLSFTDNGNGSGVLTGTPTAGANYNVVLTATDGETTANQSFVIVVPTGNSIPSFSSMPIETATEDVEYIYNITVQDVDNDAVVITCQTNANWLTFAYNGNGTATLNGTPTDDNIGTFEITLSATDNIGAPATQIFTVEVVNVNDVPQITSTATTTAQVAVEYSYTITATDGDNNATLSFEINAPAWLSLTDNNDGTATITGIPTNEFLGTNNVTVTVTDGTAPVEQAYVITVEAAELVTGIEDSEIIIYPNPVSDFIILSASLNVELYNVNGCLILKENNTNKVNVSALTEGLYILKVQDNSGIYTAKIQIAR